MHKDTRWYLTMVPAPHHSEGAPFVTVDSDTMQLDPAGFFHTHRWQFSDVLGNESAIVRTVRFCDLEIAPSVDFAGFGAKLFRVKVSTPVDPSLRIEMAVPWNDDGRLTPQEVLSEEIRDLAELTGGEIAFPDQLINRLGDIFPGRRPENLEIDWEPRELVMGEGESETLSVTIRSRSAFAFCFGS
jgi:hypothetical protein